MPAEPTNFTRAMARVPGPVAVATTVDSTGHRWGFTGTSFSSLSLDPPLVLNCLGRTASTHTVFTGASHLMINILGEEHVEVARRFATSGVDRFAAGDMKTCELGLPGLPAATVRLACALHRVVDGGDHSILVGRVLNTYVSDLAPLVYCDREFGGVAPAPHLTRAR
jgi:flavin reductase (DIM6/NTAB) family NADH-FMN oxidoreductase RutF